MNWKKHRTSWTLPVLVLGLMVAVACSGETSFQGLELDSPDIAPPFQLEDQFSNPVSLSDFAGKVVVLTFLYTYCPDICPITTETLRRTDELLGNDAMEVQFLAISVDPPRDTVERAYEYSLERGMLDKWRYLVGTEEQLAPIWISYWLDPSSDDSDHGSHSDGSQEEENVGYLVSHTAPVLLIDRDGLRRVLFTEVSLDYQPLVHDIRLLMR